ncbi:MAG TPA: hypothetical protein VIH40_07550 [Xanthobacteraceae bacterium]
MRAIWAAVVTAMLTAPAHAQRADTKEPRGVDPIAEAEKKRTSEEIDRAYRSAIDRVPAASQKFDPWGGVREVEPAKPKKK